MKYFNRKERRKKHRDRRKVTKGAFGWDGLSQKLREANRKHRR